MRLLGVLLLMFIPSVATAGLHYSGERTAELPSQWSGFLIDHRNLRSIGFEKPGNLPPSPLRDQYLAALKKLDALADLSADQLADEGALYVRLGKPEKAIELLRPAARQFPDHFRIAANLGTAWHLAGDLEQAAVHLEDAARLAPEQFRDAERLHLKLVKLRQKEGRALKLDAVDDLFGAKYVGESGNAEAGTIAAGEMKKLPANAAALIQQLALWLPADGRLLWQVGEIANAFGDVRTAAAILDGCVSEFSLPSPDLRKRRQLYRAAADELAKKPDHEQHRGSLKFKSARPLLKTLDEASLPPIRADGANPLGWLVLGATVLGEKPKFPKYLEQLDGKPVVILGYMQPLGKETNATAFLLLEYPVGCWFCESPEPTGLVNVELKAGTTAELKRGLVKVTGTLKLNSDDPEAFLFRVTNARLSEPE